MIFLPAASRLSGILTGASLGVSPMYHCVWICGREGRDSSGFLSHRCQHMERPLPLQKAK